MRDKSYKEKKVEPASNEVFPLEGDTSTLETFDVARKHERRLNI